MRDQTDPPKMVTPPTGNEGPDLIECDPVNVDAATLTAHLAVPTADSQTPAKSAPQPSTASQSDMAPATHAEPTPHGERRRPDYQFDARLAALERLLKNFRPERMAHLILSCAALLTLLTAAGMMIIRGTAGIAELSVVFGSSGLITYTSGRLLHMWNQAFRMLYGSDK